MKKREKLSLELAGYVGVIFVISLFCFGFLYSISDSILLKLEMEYEVQSNILYTNEFSLYVTIVCVFASFIVFFLLFLYFVGQKAIYIMSIIRGVKKLREGDLNHRIPLNGNDELTELAENVNSFSASMQQYIENESRLKKEQEDLIRSLSHDIRTPLTSIKSYSEFIKDKYEPNDEKFQSYMDIIQKKICQIEQMMDMLTSNHLKKENKVENGKLLIEQLLSELELSLEDAGFYLKVNKEQLTNFHTTIEVHDLQRIFDNLYSNIIKYANLNEEIRFEIILDGDYLVIQEENHILTKDPSEISSSKIGLENIRQLTLKYNGEMKVVMYGCIYKIYIKLKIT